MFGILHQEPDVTVNTVARAYQQLEAAGLAEGNRRKENFVKTGDISTSLAAPTTLVFRFES